MRKLTYLYWNVREALPIPLSILYDTLGAGGWEHICSAKRSQQAKPRRAKHTTTTTKCPRALVARYIHRKKACAARRPPPPMCRNPKRCSRVQPQVRNAWAYTVTHGINAARNLGRRAPHGAPLSCYGAYSSMGCSQNFPPGMGTEIHPNGLNHMNLGDWDAIRTIG